VHGSMDRGRAQITDIWPTSLMLSRRGHPRRTAALHAFSLTLSIAQRDAPSRRSRSGVTGLGIVVGELPVDATGERRGRGGKISPDQACPVRHVRALSGGVVGSVWPATMRHLDAGQ
jgi:hypothetical protein